MTAVKICGLQRLEDVEAVNQLRPEYAGFVFAASKRKVTIEQARILLNHLDARVKRVGVFVNMEIPEVNTIATLCRLDVIQLHGDEAQDYCRQLSAWPIWKSFAVQSTQGMDCLNKYEVQGYLFDTYVPGQYGGTGKKLNWGQLAAIDLPRPMILAGGLNPENVQEAIALLQPDVVDVSSGVEADGQKSFKKIQSFIRQVRSGVIGDKDFR